MCHTVVCTGTQNSLSITGSQEKHYNLFKDRYEGCRIIMGNLEITSIDRSRDLTFLKVVSFAYTFPPPSFSIKCIKFHLDSPNHSYRLKGLYRPYIYDTPLILAPRGQERTQSEEEHRVGEPSFQG